MIKIKNIQIDKLPNGRYRAMDLTKDTGYGLLKRARGNTIKEAISNLVTKKL